MYGILGKTLFLVCWLQGTGVLITYIEVCFMVGYRGKNRFMLALEASDSIAEWLTFKAWGCHWLIGFQRHVHWRELSSLISYRLLVTMVTELSLFGYTSLKPAMVVVTMAIGHLSFPRSMGTGVTSFYMRTIFLLQNLTPEISPSIHKRTLSFAHKGVAFSCGHKR